MPAPEPGLYLLHIRDGCERLKECVPHPEIPWREMNDLRNVLIHNYEGADPDMLWGIVDREVPQLLSAIRRLLDEEPR